MFNDLIQGSRPLMTYTNWRAGPPEGEELRERIEFFIRGCYGEEVLAKAHSAMIILTGAAKTADSGQG